MPRPATLPVPLVLGAFFAALVALGAPVAPCWAQAQTEPPPTAPATPPAPGEAPAPSPAAAPPPAAAAGPAAPLPSAPPPGTAMMTAPGELTPLPPAEDKPPFYKETWFWAVVGVAVLTATMITIGLSSQGPSTPNTDLGNMRAY